MDESRTPDQYDDPCHVCGNLYCMDQPSETGLTSTTPSTSSSGVSKIPLRSMLVTGFGMRNWDSLTRALLDDEQRKQMLLAQHAKEDVEEFECQSISSTSSKLYGYKSSTVSTRSTDLAPIGLKPRSLEYLMGLEAADEGVGEKPGPSGGRLPSVEGEVEGEAAARSTLAMRKARNYLKDHRIFDFFRFLIAHLLSELPDNPVQFIVDLLDKCLLYRSGFGHPPLLFEKAHIEQLFYLMDPMRTGFIEKEQYETGLKTLGICSYDTHPPLSTENMVSKDFFIEEAYECLTDLFVDMVRRRGGQVTPPSIAPPPPTAQTTWPDIHDRLSLLGEK